uniref:Uncharacterized protein n=1 Tax=Parascaris equorum TaxID=6256 RepID=A0A914RSZ6_PAREQ
MSAREAAQGARNIADTGNYQSQGEALRTWYALDSDDSCRRGSSNAMLKRPICIAESDQLTVNTAKGGDRIVGVQNL